MRRPTGDLSQTARLLRVVTHPTEVIRRADLRELEDAQRPSPALSRVLLVSSAVLAVSGLVLVVTAVLIRVPQMFLVGFLMVSAGMAAASLEGLLWPEPEWLVKIKGMVQR